MAALFLGTAPLFSSAQPAVAHGLYQGVIPLNFGAAITGTLDDTSFRQMYTFTANAGDIITISMSRVDGDLDPYLLLTDERGSILAFSDDHGAGMDATIAYKRIADSGSYFVIATRFGQEHGSTSGQYTLSLERVGTGVADTAATTTIHYNDSAIGRITNEHPLSFYFVRAQRGDVISISMRRTSGSLDPHLDLATPDGKILVSNDDDPLAEGTLDAAINNYTILETGLYLIVATRFGREAGDTDGSYLLTVTQRLPDELGKSTEDARLIDYGLTMSGTIDDETPVRYYRFDGSRGDVIAVTMAATSDDLDCLVKLTDANLNVLAQNEDNGRDQDARIAVYTLPATGTYYLLATRTGETGGKTSGAYSLNLTGRAGIAGGQALEIVYGATVNGLIDSENISEEYVFFGQQGDVIRITMERTSGTLDALITLQDSDHKQIAFDDDTAGNQNAVIDGFVLPRDDTYIIVASRFEKETGATDGAYLLTLELLRSN